MKTIERYAAMRELQSVFPRYVNLQGQADSRRTLALSELRDEIAAESAKISQEAVDAATGFWERTKGPIGVGGVVLDEKDHPIFRRVQRTADLLFLPATSNNGKDNAQNRRLRAISTAVLPERIDPDVLDPDKDLTPLGSKARGLALDMQSLDTYYPQLRSFSHYEDELRRLGYIRDIVRGVAFRLTPGNMIPRIQNIQIAVR